MEKVKEVTAYQDILGNLHTTLENAQNASYRISVKSSNKEFDYKIDDLLRDYRDQFTLNAPDQKYMKRFIDYTKDALLEIFLEEREAQLKILDNLGMPYDECDYYFAKLDGENDE